LELGHDPWLPFQRNQALAFALQSRGRIVVIRETESVRPTAMLEVMVDFVLSRLLKGRKLSELRESDIDLLGMDDLDPYQLGNLQRFCNANAQGKHNISGPLFPRSLPTTLHSANLQTNGGLPSTALGRSIAQKFNVITNCLDSENGLLGSLFSKGVISFRQMETWRRKSLFEANEEVLKKIIWMSEEKILSFMKSLEETNQGHIVEVIYGKSLT